MAVSKQNKRLRGYCSHTLNQVVRVVQSVWQTQLKAHGANGGKLTDLTADTCHNHQF